MNDVERGWAVGWIREAERMQEERDEARRFLLDVLLAIARNRDLLALARCELEVRWPDTPDEGEHHAA
jgi:hypothetical protein